MSTLHTPDAQSTILRIMAMFPPEEQDVIRIRLAESLYGVVSQAVAEVWVGPPLAYRLRGVSAQAP